MNDAEMREKCPRNEEEKNILKMLGEGCTIEECRKNTALTSEEMKEFLEYARKWECKHLCVPVRK